MDVGVPVDVVVDVVVDVGVPVDVVVDVGVPVGVGVGVGDTTRNPVILIWIYPPSSAAEVFQGVAPHGRSGGPC